MPNSLRRQLAPIPAAHASALEALLAERLGLDAGAVAPSFVNDVAQRCLEAAGANDLGPLLQDAERGGAAWQSIVDHAVVSETWFFRDEGPFDLVVSAVRNRFGRPGNPPTRILSCPCSTGEEPYSIAMAMQEAGLPPEAAWIDAADVSTAALSAARTGIYRARSFRGVPPVLRDRYFQQQGGEQAWQLSRDVRSRVHFTCANLVTGEGLAGREPYDIVLCRNLLIYMHDPARRRAFASFRHLLSDSGLLIVGHAEPGIAREYGFAAVGAPGAFAFAVQSAAHDAPRQMEQSAARNATQKTVRKPVQQPAQTANRVWTSPRRAATTHAIDGSPQNAGNALTAPESESDTLERIRQMGDLGRLVEAIEECRRYLASVPGSADAHYLLGVLLGASGQTSVAESALRRALYLRPDHQDALVHLALVEESRGEIESAARLRARAARLARPEGERAR